MKIQALVADQRGLDVDRLRAAIEASYLTPEGRRVSVRFGQGVYLDGYPEGALILKDAE